MDKNLVAETIERFRQHIVSGFEQVECAYQSYIKTTENRPNLVVLSFEEFYEDWAQSNWELLVERVLCGVKESLVIYGNGSDYEGGIHSRVFYRNLQATHKIRCTSNEVCSDLLEGINVDLSEYEFHSFVSLKGDWYDIATPFEHVLLEGRESHQSQVVLPIAQLEFSLHRIEI